MPKQRRKDPVRRATRAFARAARRGWDLARGRDRTIGAVVENGNIISSEEFSLGALGLVEVKLTKHEETVLSERVPIAEVRVKPGGEPYLPHAVYTRWLNRALGRLGWAIAPRAKSAKVKSGNKVQVVMPYVLYIHGTPAALAFGEQEYYDGKAPDDALETFGDAVEGTVASALRRCAKRLGIGLELWDKRWIAEFLKGHCVAVQVRGRGRVEVLWRRKDDPAFAGEIGPRPARSAGHHKQRGAKITPLQVGRLWTIAGHADRSKVEVHTWLEAKYGITSAKDITRGNYEDVCKAIEQPGPLRVN